MKYNIITIEREYASGGRTIGKRLAEQLDIPYYGKEILEIVAKRGEVRPEEIEHLEERATSSLLYSLYVFSQETRGQSAGIAGAEALQLAEAKVIRELATEGPAVMIGRCASQALADRHDVLNVFIYASKEARLKRAIEEYQIEPQKAETVLKQYDRQRENYYTTNTGKKWNDRENYHLLLDSSKLGIEGCVQALANIARNAAG